MTLHKKLASALTIAALAVATTSMCGCAALSPEEKAAKRAELDEMAETTLTRLREREPDLGDLLGRSIGYVVIDMTLTKIPMIGTGNGVGVVIDKRSGTHSYLKVSRFDIGSGFGAQKFRILIVFEDPKLLDRAMTGAWHYEAGAEASVGTTSTEGTAQPVTEGYRAFKLVERGAVAAVTVRLAHAKPYLN